MTLDEIGLGKYSNVSSPAVSFFIGFGKEYQNEVELYGGTGFGMSDFMAQNEGILLGAVQNIFVPRHFPSGCFLKSFSSAFALSIGIEDEGWHKTKIPKDRLFVYSSLGACAFHLVSCAVTEIRGKDGFNWSSAAGLVAGLGASYLVNKYVPQQNPRPKSWYYKDPKTQSAGIGVSISLPLNNPSEQFSNNPAAQFYRRHMHGN